MDLRFIYFRTCRRGVVAEVVFNMRKKEIVDIFLVREEINPKLYKYPNPIPEEEMKKVRKLVRNHGCRIVDENWVAIF